MELAVPSFVFTPGRIFRNLLSLVLKDQKPFLSLAALTGRVPLTGRNIPQETTNRMLIEGTSPSIRIRSRFPLHPSLPSLPRLEDMDGVSIEVGR
jgi:hypothetical protein